MYTERETCNMSCFRSVEIHLQCNRQAGHIAELFIRMGIYNDFKCFPEKNPQCVIKFTCSDRKVHSDPFMRHQV